MSNLLTLHGFYGGCSQHFIWYSKSFDSIQPGKCHCFKNPMQSQAVPGSNPGGLCRPNVHSSFFRSRGGHDGLECPRGEILSAASLLLWGGCLGALGQRTALVPRFLNSMSGTLKGHFQWHSCNRSSFWRIGVFSAPPCLI